MIFQDIESLQKSYPGPTQMIMRENERQYPQAKFIVAGLDEEGMLMAFYDVGTLNEVLWVWIGGELEDPDGDVGAYIDEYYEIPLSEAEGHYGFIFNKRTQ